jgi:hypothetical protein
MPIPTRARTSALGGYVTGHGIGRMPHPATQVHWLSRRAAHPPAMFDALVPLGSGQGFAEPDWGCPGLPEARPYEAFTSP